MSRLLIPHALLLSTRAGLFGDRGPEPVDDPAIVAQARAVARTDRLEAIGILEAERLQFTRAIRAMFSSMDILDMATTRSQFARAPADLETYRRAVLDQLKVIAAGVGPEVFGRILQSLGRRNPLEEDPPA